MAAAPAKPELKPRYYEVVVRDEAPVYMLPYTMCACGNVMLVTRTEDPGVYWAECLRNQNPGPTCGKYRIRIPKAELA